MSLRHLFEFLRETATLRNVLKFVSFEIVVFAVATTLGWIAFQVSNLYILTIPFGLAIALYGVKIAGIVREGTRRIGEDDWSSKYVLIVFGGMGAIVAIFPLLAG